MGTVRISTLVEAERGTVFEAFTDFAWSRRHIPSVTKVEMISLGDVRVGTRFKETRQALGRDEVEDVKVVSYHRGKSYELHTEVHGTEYRESYKFKKEGACTRVEMEFKVKPLSRSAKLKTPLGWLMKPIIKKNLQGDLDGLRQAIERRRVQRELVD
jgi:hypothetical protein